MRATFFPALVLVAFVGTRVFGARLGVVRAVAVAWLGLLSASVIVFGTGEVEESRLAGVGVIVLGLVAMVAWAALADLVVPAGPATTTHRNPLTAWRRAWRRWRRQAQLAALAARFGLRRHARPRGSVPSGVATGRALRECLQRAGGVFVKLGQFLSTRADLVSTEIALELGALQQDADPMPLAEVKRVVAEDLASRGQPELFSMEELPSAAASIAQVHRGVTPCGRPVAVKVQRPDVADRIACDLDLLERSAVRLERRTTWARDLGVARTVHAFARSVRGELDFVAEARNLRMLGAAVRSHDGVVVPEPIAEYTSGRVLVMDWIDGRRVTSGVEDLPSERRRDLARALLGCFLDQILVVGTFHADPHPGNVLLTVEGQIALIDCGSVGVLDRRQRAALRSIVIAVAAHDPSRLAAAVRRITTASRSVDHIELERALGAVVVDHLRQGAPPGSDLIADLMGQLRQFGLAVEPMIAGALRAVATLQSTLQLLDPEFDLVGEAVGHARGAAIGDVRPELGLRPQVESVVVDLLPTLAELPRRVDRMVEAVERDEFAVGIHLFATDRDRAFALQLVSLLSLALVPAAVGVIGALLVLAASVQRDPASGRLLQAAGLACVGMALLVLFGALARATRFRREGS